MGLTNFPNGVSSFGVPVMGSGAAVPVTTGKYYFVDSNTGAAGNAGTVITKPVASVVQAIARSTANNDDVIIVLPGHTETLSGAGAWTPKAGSTIVGLGNGQRRPKITVGGVTTTTIAISAANVTIKNILLVGGEDELVTVFNVTAAYLTLEAVDFEASAKKVLSFLTTTANGNNVTIRNCTHFQSAIPTGNAPWIKLVGSNDTVIEGNKFFVVTSNHGDSGVIHGATTASLRLFIAYNLFSATGGTSVVPVKLQANSTGVFAWNATTSLKTATAGSNAIADLCSIESYAVSTVNKSGILDPVVE